MKIVPIFVSEASVDGLWSIHVEAASKNEFARFFVCMTDVEWLNNFFRQNRADLNRDIFGNPSIHEAVEKTIEEVQAMENALYYFTEQGFRGGNTNLQFLFKPLNNWEYTITIHQKSKARIGNGWLRLYALRLGPNSYMVTGGAIKLTQGMKRDHLQKELKKLEQARTLLRNHGIYYPEDLNNYDNE